MKTFFFPKNIYFPEILLHEPNAALYLHIFTTSNDTIDIDVVEAFIIKK